MLNFFRSGACQLLKIASRQFNPYIFKVCRYPMAGKAVSIKTS
jgi:hypothetical protein